VVFKLGGQSYEADVENCAVLHYDNDILDGLYIDLDETYAFVTLHEESHVYPILQAGEMGVVDYFQEGEIDYTQPPHCYVVASVGRIIAASAEMICEEACGE
jgi:hypothetical protein